MAWSWKHKVYDEDIVTEQDYVFRWRFNTAWYITLRVVLVRVQFLFAEKCLAVLAAQESRTLVEPDTFHSVCLCDLEGKWEVCKEEGLSQFLVIPYTKAVVLWPCLQRCQIAAAAGQVDSGAVWWAQGENESSETFANTIKCKCMGYWWLPMPTLNILKTFPLLLFWNKALEAPCLSESMQITALSSREVGFYCKHWYFYQRTVAGNDRTLVKTIKHFYVCTELNKTASIDQCSTASNML